MSPTVSSTLTPCVFRLSAKPNKFWLLWNFENILKKYRNFLWFLKYCRTNFETKKKTVTYRAPYRTSDKKIKNAGPKWKTKFKNSLTHFTTHTYFKSSKFSLNYYYTHTQMFQIMFRKKIKKNIHSLILLPFFIARPNY